MNARSCRAAPKPPPGGKMRLPLLETRFDLAASLDRTPLP